MNKWDQRFLDMARLVASWSKDPSTQCGAVITQGKRIISLGFNGFPAGCDDNPQIYANRPRKYKRVLHAEQNALLFAPLSLVGASCYVWPMPPCSTCCGMLIQKGVNRIVTIVPNEEQQERWGDAFNESVQMCNEAGVELLLARTDVVAPA